MIQERKEDGQQQPYNGAILTIMIISVVCVVGFTLVVSPLHLLSDEQYDKVRNNVSGRYMVHCIPEGKKILDVS